MTNPEDESTENAAEDAAGDLVKEKAATDEVVEKKVAADPSAKDSASDDSDESPSVEPSDAVGPTLASQLVSVLRSRRIVALIVVGMLVITTLIVKSFFPSAKIEEVPLALSDTLRLEQEFEKIVSGETIRLYVADYEVSDDMLEDLPIEVLREAKRKALAKRGQPDEPQPKDESADMSGTMKEIYNADGKRINFDTPTWHDYPRVEAVLLDQGKITDRGLAKIAQLPDLEHIRLRLSPITDEGVKSLAGCEELWLVNLPHSELTNEGIRSLASLPKLKQLRLGSEQLTNDCCRVIAELASLRGIHLIGIPVTDDGIKVLAELPHLESLYIDDSAVTESGWEWVFRNHPELHVHVNQRHHDRDPQAHPHSGPQ